MRSETPSCVKQTGRVLDNRTVRVGCECGGVGLQKGVSSGPEPGAEPRQGLGLPQLWGEETAVPAGRQVRKARESRRRQTWARGRPSVDGVGLHSEGDRKLGL